MTLLTAVEDYYTKKIQTHGLSSQGVDWKDTDGQQLRFEQLAKILPDHPSFSINDVGCGYGSLVDFLFLKFNDQFQYCGIDLSEAMINAAKQSHAEKQNIDFIIGSEPKLCADFSVASGIFNVRLETPDDEWLDYIYKTLDMIHAKSNLGFSFNCLTSYSDKDKMRDYLYYADPCVLFDHCKKNYSKNVALFHDYGLYEFTMLVRK